MIIKNYTRIVLITSCSFLMLLTGFKSITQPQTTVAYPSQIVRLTPDTVSMIRNPMTGWAIYATAGTKSDYWEKFDNIPVPSLQKTVKVSDYANILYIRVGWADFEPTEGEYAWNKESLIKMLIEGAEKRHLKLAFRINVDSRDKAAQCTPEYVHEAGAKGFTSRTGRSTLWSPYPDDPVFQQKYEKFLQAFAAKFNDPDKVDFIDGYGLGKWGESHSVLYTDVTNRGKVFDWITDLYIRYFTKVPLAINYHRLIGTPMEWAAPDKDSKQLLAGAFNKGFMLRHDAFGMTDFYKDFEKSIPAEWFPKLPVIAEGGWLHNGQDGYLKDSRGFKNWGEVWKGEYDDAIEAHVNVMDLRGYADASSWFETSFSLIQKFNVIGGYRLYPNKLSLPTTFKNNSKITITHEWSNLGIGFCPTNLPQWHQKYKVAFALLNAKGKVQGKIFIDYKTDLSKWLKGQPSAYSFTIPTIHINPGKYQWAVGIIDTSKNNKIGLNLAVTQKANADGWIKVGSVTGG